jgi:hypothetical protein
MLEITDAITKEVLEQITFVLTYPTVFPLPLPSLVKAGQKGKRCEEM